jgi:hypothetical protein
MKFSLAPRATLSFLSSSLKMYMVMTAQSQNKGHQQYTNCQDKVSAYFTGCTKLHRNHMEESRNKLQKFSLNNNNNKKQDYIQKVDGIFTLNG